jgi:hypothetical protein
MNDSTFTGNNLQGAVQAFGAGLYNLGNSVITNCKFNEKLGRKGWRRSVQHIRRNHQSLRIHW